jgi:DNA-binding NarL/FixJ family response regulator
MSIRLLLAEDHRIVREGLAALLLREPDMDLVGEAADGAELLKLARELHPDLVITDLSMPGLNGMEAMRRILAEVADVKILCLSVHDERPLVAAVIDAGAAGYLLKDCAFTELVRAVRAAVAGQVYLSPAIAGIVVEGYRAKRADAVESAFSQLTAKEREIVQLLAEGHSTKEIAARLSVSSKTVGTHREHIMGKLQLHSIAQLTRYAIREGLTSLDGDLSRRSGGSSRSA